jgi:hypothetical protein
MNEKVQVSVRTCHRIGTGISIRTRPHKRAKPNIPSLRRRLHFVLSRANTPARFCDPDAPSVCSVGSVSMSYDGNADARTILYLDGAPRSFQDFGCSGTQSSRRLDDRIVEIQRVCESPEWVWHLRQAARLNELIIQITEK